MDLDKYKLIQGQFIDLSLIDEGDAEDIYNWRTSASGAFLNRPSEYSVESQKKMDNWAARKRIKLSHLFEG